MFKKLTIIATSFVLVSSVMMDSTVASKPWKYQYKVEKQQRAKAGAWEERQDFQTDFTLSRHFNINSFVGVALVALLITGNRATGQPIAYAANGSSQLDSGFNNSTALTCPVNSSSATLMASSGNLFTPAEAYAATTSMERKGKSATRKKEKKRRAKRKSEKKELTAQGKQINDALENIMQELMTPEEKNWEVYGALEKQIPVFADGNIINSFYRDIKVINAGSRNYIFNATLLQNRGAASNGTTIALRVIRASNDYRSFPKMLDAYSNLGQLRDNEITEFIPAVHGVYYTAYSPAFHVQNRIEPGSHLLVIEMDLMEREYEQEFYYRDRKPMSPRVAFEHLIGKWAVYRIAQCSITDYDGDVIRHYMLQYDPNFAVYHIGERAYLFDPGYSPRQVDYDDYQPWKERATTKDFERQIPDHILSRVEINESSMRRFVDEVPQKGIVQSASDNLSEFEVTDLRPIPNVSNVKHFYLPKEALNDLDGR